MNKLTIAIVVVVAISAIFSIVVKSQPRISCKDITNTHNELIKNVMNGEAYAPDSAEMKQILNISNKCVAEIKSKDIDKIRCKAANNLNTIVETIYLNTLNNKSNEYTEKTLTMFSTLQKDLEDTKIESCEYTTKLQSSLDNQIKELNKIK